MPIRLGSGATSKEEGHGLMEREGSRKPQRQYGEFWRKRVGQEAPVGWGWWWRRQKEWPGDSETASAIQEGDKALKREGGRGESGDLEDKRKTVNAGWWEVNNHSSWCLQLCFCTGTEWHWPQQLQGYFSINLEHNLEITYSSGLITNRTKC